MTCVIVFFFQILETDFAIALFVILMAQPNRMILPVKKPMTDLEAGSRQRVL